MARMDRRQLLARSLTVGAGAWLGSKMITGCSSGPSCSDVSGLSPMDISMRDANAYVDHSPDATKHCSGCNFFQARGANACGGCTVIKGPIHPDGYCRLWVAKSS